jgi:hypothetical protein
VRTRAVFVACAAALALVAFVGRSTAVPRGIVLDHSIGPVSVLETRAAVERVLGRGRPGKPDLREHWVIVRYPDAGLKVGYSSRTAMDRIHEHVVFVLTTSPRFRTPRGAGVGSLPKAVSSIPGMTCYGGSSPYACEHGMAPGKTGTDFAFRDGKVWRVTIGVSGIFG